jgi:NO-binding membrane sensor protein with MHYT domain
MTNTMADYSMLLVLISYLVSVLGALTGLMLAENIAGRDGRIRVTWLVLASITLGGCAIWAMHFIGMLAYDPGVPVSYGIPLTFASLVLPILFTMVGLYVVHRWRASRGAWLAAGVVMGLGVATMHYTGMAAMRISAEMSYDRVLLAASVLIAIVAATAALRIAVAWRGVARHASALIMGVAVCGMHYTGMAAMRIHSVSVEVDYFANAVTRPLMELAVTVAVTTVLVSALVIAVGYKLNTPVAAQSDI